MKKLLLISILTLSTLNMFAQATEIGFLRVELSAGVFSTNDGYITGFEQTPSPYFYDPNPGFLWETSDNSTLVFFADMSFFKYKRMEVGLNLGYQQLSTNNAAYGTPDPVTSLYPTERVSIDVFSFMPEFRINWLTSDDKKFEMYSGASFGLNFINEQHSVNSSENASYKQPAIHINGFGLRFGDKFAGFIEVGVGARGLMSCGLSYRP